jgi:hypothetical protein
LIYFAVKRQFKGFQMTNKKVSKSSGRVKSPGPRISADEVREPRESIVQFQKPRSKFWMGLAVLLLAGGGYFYLDTQTDKLENIKQYVRAQTAVIQQPKEKPAPQNKTSSVKTRVPPSDAAALAAKKLAAEKAAMLEAEIEKRVEERMARLDSRVEEITRLSGEIEQRSYRMENLFLATAVGNAVRDGLPLGYLEDHLNLRFGTTKPQEVATLLKAARNPVTIDSLLLALTGVNQSLSQNSGSSWSNVKRELQTLFVIRKGSKPTTNASGDMVRIRELVKERELQRAMTMMDRLPDNDASRTWKAKAHEYVKIQEAISAIEQAAFLDLVHNPISQKPLPEKSSKPKSEPATSPTPMMEPEAEDPANSTSVVNPIL